MVVVQGERPPSVVTIDPVVAKEIVGIVDDPTYRDSSSSDASLPKQKEESTAPNDDKPTTIPPSQRTVIKRKVAGKTEGRTRSNSLRHVKNSTEVLRQRSKTIKPLDSLSESGSSTRGGRQFTVGNVGNNGMIYLRYVVEAQRFLVYSNAALDQYQNQLTPNCNHLP